MTSIRSKKLKPSLPKGLKLKSPSSASGALSAVSWDWALRRVAGGGSPMMDWRLHGRTALSVATMMFSRSFVRVYVCA
jgi:hypothetical protein